MRLLSAAIVFVVLTICVDLPINLFVAIAVTPFMCFSSAYHMWTERWISQSYGHLRDLVVEMPMMIFLTIAVGMPVRILIAIGVSFHILPKEMGREYGIRPKMLVRKELR